MLLSDSDRDWVVRFLRRSSLGNALIPSGMERAVVGALAYSDNFAVLLQNKPIDLLNPQKRAHLIEKIKEWEISCDVPSNLEEGIIAIAWSFGREPVLVADASFCLRAIDGDDSLSLEKKSDFIAALDRDICIQCLVADGMSEEEAEEFFEFNIIGAYVGRYTPAFIDFGADANV